MSSLPGEPALKHGLSFEIAWTIRHLIEVMEERASSIQIGGAPFEAGVDFKLVTGDREEHHQVKKAHGYKDRWTPATLDEAGVLPDFNTRLNSPRVTCVFVSTIGCPVFGHLADRARDADDFIDFQANYLASDYKKDFYSIVSRWDCPPERAWEKLRRVKAEVASLNRLEKDSLVLLGNLVDGSAIDAMWALSKLCTSRIHNPLSSHDIWTWMQESGIAEKPFTSGRGIWSKVNVQTEKYLSSVRRDFIIDPSLPRTATKTAMQALTEPSEGKTVAILGTPGAGKSTVIHELIVSLSQKGWPILALRLDGFEADLTYKSFVEELDLSTSPVKALAYLAGPKPSLLVLDQLDALSQYSGRTGQMIDRIQEIKEEVDAVRMRSPLHLVLACREADWKHDGRLRAIGSPTHPKDSGPCTEVQVGNLNDAEIAQLLRKVNLTLANFSSRQKEQLLRKPQYIAVLIQSGITESQIPKILCPKDLFDVYWDVKQRRLLNSTPSPTYNWWSKILEEITDQLSRMANSLTPTQPPRAYSDEGPLSVPKRTLEVHQPFVDRMVTHGVLAEEAGRYRFAHETFFDYCFARFFSARGKNLLHYLLEGDQTLIQRAQVRQILEFQRDENFGIYLSNIRTLLDATDIRPHLKQLVIFWMCDLAEPRSEEWEILRPLVELGLSELELGVQSGTSHSALKGFLKSRGLFRWSYKDGDFESWLKNQGELGLGALFRTLLNNHEVNEKEVWSLIAPLIGIERFNEHLFWISEFLHVSQSREMFAWIVGGACSRITNRDKELSQYPQYNTISEHLSQTRPDWLAEMLGRVISAQIGAGEVRLSSALPEHFMESHAISRAATHASSDFVSHVLPAIDALVGNRVIGGYGPWSSSGVVSIDGGDDDGHSLDETLFNALATALKNLIRIDYEVAINWLKKLESSQHTPLRRLLGTVLCDNEVSLTAFVGAYLEQGDKAFTDTDKRWSMSAPKLLRRYAKDFSNDEFDAIESKILQVVKPSEMRCKAEFRSQTKHLGNYRGYFQLILLRELPPERLSTKARKCLMELERKFTPLFRASQIRGESKAIPTSACQNWQPNDFHGAFSRAAKRGKEHYDLSDDGREISRAMAEHIKADPEPYVAYFESLNEDDSEDFFAYVIEGLLNTDLSPDQVYRAVRTLHRRGEEHGMRKVELLRKLSLESLNDEMMGILVHLVTNGDVESRNGYGSNESRVRHLEFVAINSTRGVAIDVLRHFLSQNASLVEKVKVTLEQMVREPFAAIRALAPGLCYSLAVHARHREFAMNLFCTFARDVPDVHVLASRWSLKFINDGMRGHWHLLKEVIVEMASTHEVEVRVSGVRLSCFAVVLQLEPTEFVDGFIRDEDFAVRKCVAEVLSRNLETVEIQRWCMDTLLLLANDENREVCHTVGIGFEKASKQQAHLQLIAAYLVPFVQSRAFEMAPSSLISAIGESRGLLPLAVFDVMYLALTRLVSLKNLKEHRFVRYFGELNQIAIRLYHEHRDDIHRRKALDLIDQLCLVGAMESEALD